MSLKTISFLDTYVLRTAALPISFYTTLLENYTTQSLFKTVEKSFVKNAIRLASPELILEYEKHKANPNDYSNGKTRNLELSILKYIARMSSRATPFGLFAGCSTGSITTETKIQLKEEFTTHTQFDMQFWISLLQNIAKDISVRKQLIYYPNTSLYTVGNFYRYIEYKFVHKKREHSISSVRKNPFLEIIIDKSKQGLKIEDLVSLIIDSESEREEAIEFIEEIIENQILVSNLETAVTGSNEVERILAILKECKNIDKENLVLNNIYNKITSLNKPLSLDRSNALFIQEKIKELNVGFDEKYLLQTDLYTKTISSTLNKSIIKKLTKAIVFLGEIQEINLNPNLQNFKRAFQKRYENKEMPLSLVLDTEIGIGYLQNLDINDSNPILDSFSISKNVTNKKTEVWTSNDYILESKLQNCIANYETSIILKDKDFKKTGIKNLPSTFSAMIEVVNQNNEELIILDSLGNFSSTKFIGRFCNGSAEINKLANQIVEKEEQSNKNVFFAEIAHIPESRTGNILRRPVLRTYEIPYLSNSTLPKENQIEINDLMVSVKSDKIILRSKRLDKEIIPCLSNAHNYSSNSLPIYHFLSELQGQNSNPIHKFDWGVLKNHYTYFPRVLYQNVILSKAKWIISDTELKTIITFNDFEIWRNKKYIPQYVNIVKGDNTLLLDLEKEICFYLLKKEVKNKITLEEFLFTESSIIKDEKDNHFVNQFIISFYNKE